MPVACPANLPPHTRQSCSLAMLAIHDSLDLLGGKWKLPIILALTGGPKRFKQLQREITDVTAKMLSKELKELEVNQLISRTVFPETVPVAVEYELTDYGRTLQPVIGALADWGQQHRRRIMQPEPRGAAASVAVPA